mmetsp:Transcript_3046/g.8826  ORF Transcript_3046/g.8826 Transcript_3046/m.8826 type:complete len:227 (-) Transcript_3046:1936-2616(-)
MKLKMAHTTHPFRIEGHGESRRFVQNVNRGRLASHSRFVKEGDGHAQHEVLLATPVQGCDRHQQVVEAKIGEIGSRGPSHHVQKQFLADLLQDQFAFTTMAVMSSISGHPACCHLERASDTTLNAMAEASAPEAASAATSSGLMTSHTPSDAAIMALPGTNGKVGLTVGSEMRPTAAASTSPSERDMASPGLSVPFATIRLPPWNGFTSPPHRSIRRSASSSNLWS